jgi:hypothetical protein
MHACTTNKTILLQSDHIYIIYIFLFICVLAFAAVVSFLFITPYMLTCLRLVVAIPAMLLGEQQPPHHTQGAERPCSHCPAC